MRPLLVLNYLVIVARENRSIIVLTTKLDENLFVKAIISCHQLLLNVIISNHHPESASTNAIVQMHKDCCRDVIFKIIRSAIISTSIMLVLAERRHKALIHWSLTVQRSLSPATSNKWRQAVNIYIDAREFNFDSYVYEIDDNIFSSKKQKDSPQTVFAYF